MLKRALGIVRRGTFAAPRTAQVASSGRFVQHSGNFRLLCTEKNLPNGQKSESNNQSPDTSSASASLGKEDVVSHIDKPPVGDKKIESHDKPAPHHTATNLGSTVSQVSSNIASTIHFTQQKYDEFEKNVMQSIHYKNQQRFRALLLGSVLLIAWITIVFGSRLRKYFTEQTAGLAKETLENKELKVQTEELATAVVQAILENKAVTAHAAAFLKDAASVPETQQAMLKLTLHILQHEETMGELKKIAQALIKDLASDPEMVNELSRLLEKVLADKDLKAALITLVGQLCQDKEVFAVVTDLVLKLGAEEKVQQAATKLLTGTISDVMQDEDISHQSKDFIADVVGDDLLQKEGGHALWKSIKYAIQPGIIRVTGVTLVVVSVAFAKLMLSPY